MRLAGLRDPDPVVRDASAASLGIWHPPVAVEALRAQLERETDPGVKDTLGQHVSRLEQAQLWAQRAGEADME